MRHPRSEVLSDYLDGELPHRETRELEAHLNECAACLALLRDFREIRVRARSLEDQVPERDLWPEIARAIRDEKARDPQVIELRSWAAPGPSRAEPGAFKLSYLQAAAAGLVLALFSGVLGALLSGGPPSPGVVTGESPAPWVQMVSSASPGLGDAAREVARLEESLAEHSDQIKPETARILEKNLAVIDRAIQESVRALEADPGNAFLENHLARSVEAKADYLREAAAFVVPVS
jgi:negative regulator of sigma E activity